MAIENPEDFMSVKISGDSVTSISDQFCQATCTDTESESLGVDLLDDFDSYMQDLDDRLTISRMVSDSVIKGMVAAVEQEAADRISQQESEIDRLKERLFPYNVSADSGVLGYPTCTGIEGNAWPKSNICLPVKSIKSDRIRDFLMEHETEARNQLTKLKEQIHTVGTRSLNESCNSRLKLSMGFDYTSITPSDKTLERFSDIEREVDLLQINLDSFFNHVTVYLSRSSVFEWHQEREIKAELEAMIITIYFKVVIDEIDGILCDGNSQVGVNGSINFLRKWREVLSSLRQELDGLNKQLSFPGAGHTTSIGSMDNCEGCGHRGNSKVTGHVCKPSGSYIFSSSPPWEANGKGEELTITMLENIDPAKLMHLSKEDLVDHFKTEMIKMKRNHESKMQEITEEYFRLKREYLREHGSSLPLKKDRDLDELKRKIPESILKLDEILVESEAFPLSIDIDGLGKIKERLNALLSENTHLRDMLSVRKRIEHPSANVYDSGRKISHYSSDKKKFLKVTENLKCEEEEEEERIKFTIYEQVYQCFLKMLPTDIYINDNLCTVSTSRNDICEVSLQEAISDHRIIRKSDCEDLYLESLISQEFSGLVFVQVLKEVMEKFDYLNNESLYEKYLRVSLEQEVLDKAELVKFEVAENLRLKEEISWLETLMGEKDRLAEETGKELARERELFDRATQEIDMLKDETRRHCLFIEVISNESEKIRSDLGQALEKNEMYKADHCKLNQKLDYAMEELNQKEKEQKFLLQAAQERHEKLLLAEENERLYRRQLESVTESSLSVMKSLDIVENRAAVDIRRILSSEGSDLFLSESPAALGTENVYLKSRRKQLLKMLKLYVGHNVVGMLDFELKSLSQAAKLLQRWGLTYKQRFERKCVDLDKAENEVDLLGDKVDNLLGLLEKIYIALDHYSPVLKHYPGVMEILKLIKGHLSGEPVKSV